MPTVLPPLDCSLKLSEIIDIHIAHKNSGTFHTFADDTGHITEISRFEFCRAAHLLRPKRHGPEGEVMAIVALTDGLLYQALVAGCIKECMIPFPISHRNSAVGVLHLLSSTRSHRLLTTKGFLAHLVDTVGAELSVQKPPYELEIEEIPLLGQIYPHLGHETTEHAFVPYPDPATRTSLDDVALYLHPSGSTGFPKSIPEPHRTVIHYFALGFHAMRSERCRPSTL
ncbi:amp-CoA ligase [Mycena latifolia]|nr:amp-CoA ligase [Mycena latifolia]